MCLFMQNTESKVALYILAGVATSLNFMDDFKLELTKRYERAGMEVQSSMLFPYGDWNRKLWKQVMEISYDLLPRLGQNSRGQLVADHIINTHSGGRVVIIGHSSGGVTGIHAANRLNREQYPDVNVIQIGSPKCTIPADFRKSTLFIRAVNRAGKSTDPITSIGSWGGWYKSGGIIRRNSRLKAPSSIYSIPIVGGHADYFRNREPFIDELGRSNLDKTADLIWDWLNYSNA
jgi:phosphoheptose isomerase